MIEREPFGSTGHRSSRVVFGAAGLWAASRERAATTLELLLEHGVNHVDTAASYGDSELRVGEWMERHRERFFLASKTGERDADGARTSLESSLERLRTDRLDLLQLHNLVEEEEWQRAMGPGGALEALVRARDEGLVRFLGVTGHGTFAASLHRRSLERFPFDSVLLPYSPAMMDQAEYARDFEQLYELCAERGVAMLTIKSVARRRWRGEPERRFSWYEPLQEPPAVERAVRFVLARPRLFLASSSDLRLLPTILQAAARPEPAPSREELLADAERLGIEPLFVRGVSDRI